MSVVIIPAYKPDERLVILLAVTEGGKRISGKKTQGHMRERRLHDRSGRFIINPM